MTENRPDLLNLFSSIEHIVFGKNVTCMLTVRNFLQLQGGMSNELYNTIARVILAVLFSFNLMMALICVDFGCNLNFDVFLELL